MTRNTSFHPLHEPLRNDTVLHLQRSYTDGPFSFLNPTRAYFRHAPPDCSVRPADGFNEDFQGLAYKADTLEKQSPSNIEFKWRSRDNRKGRHTLLIVSTGKDAGRCQTPRHTATHGAVGQGILRMVLVYPYWDISYLVATIFTLGSIVWVMNSFFVFLPLPDPSTEYPGEILTAGGVTAFIGATVFEIGSVLLMLEAVNEKRSGCFGWAVEKVLKDRGVDSDHLTVRPDVGECAHHHNNKKNLIGKGSTPTTRQTMVAERIAVNGGLPKDGEKSVEVNTNHSWTWFPSVYELKTHYLREIGFLACMFQLLGATIFWISGFTALPGVNNKMSQGLLDGLFWAPQVIGGSGFIVSGLLFMLETQEKWYTPSFGTLGWHIGLWNLIGAFGFTLCGCLGYAYGNSGALYQSSLATFWGSWAFLIGSVIQWALVVLVASAIYISVISSILPGVFGYMGIQ